MVSTYNTLGVAPVYFEFGGANSTSEQFIVKGITGLSSDIPIALNSPIRSGSGNIRQATPSLNNPETVTIQFLLTPERELFNWYQAATNDPQSLANRREVAISAYDSITGNLTRLEIRDAVPVNYEVVYDPTSGKAYETLTLSYQDFTTVPGLMNSSSPATVTSSPVYFKFDSPIINAKLILDINGLSLENRIGSSQTISSGKGTIKQRQATPNNQKLEPIVIKSLLTPERDLFNWYQATSSSLNGSQSFQPVEIYAIDGSTGQGIAQWNLTNAIPIAYEVNYDANGLAYETLTLAHQGIERSAPTTIPSSPLPNFDPNNANTLFNLSPTYLTFNTDITAETLIAEITGLRVESNNSSANKAIGSGKPGNKQRQATPTIQKFEPVTLKSSLTSGLDLYNWYQLTNNTNGLQSNQRNVGISAYDATNNNKVAGWNLINATPIGYEVNYSWDTGKAYESVKLAYQGLDAVSGNNNISNSGSLFGSPNPNNLNNSPSVFFEFSSGLTSTKLIGEISGLSLESSIASQLLIGSGRGGNKMLQTIPTTEQYDPLIIQSFLTSETDLFNWYKVSNDPTSVPQQFRQPLTISARDRHTGSLLAQWQVVNPHTSGYQANYDYQIGKSYETLTLVHEGIVRVDNPVDYGSTINPRDLLNIAPTYLKFNTGVTSERLIASVTGLSVETRIASQAAPTLQHSAQ